MNEIERKFQSKYGYYSIISGIFTFGYILFPYLDYKFNHSENMEKLVALLPEGGSGETGIALLIIPIFYFFVPLSGFLIGIVFGCMGIFQPKDKRTLAAVGLIINSIVPFSLLILYFLIITCAFCPR